MDAEKVSDLKTRGVGLAIAVVGGLLLNLEVFGALRAAEAHEPSIRTSFVLVAAGPIFLLLGLLMAVFGSSALGSSGVIGRRVRGADGQPSRVLGWVVVILLFAPGMALYVWLQIRLGALGFE